MIKKKLKIILKQNPIIYKVYSIFFNTMFNILKLFIRVDDKIILINSFGGQKYDDSPRVIYEYMQTQDKYSKYKIYWAFIEPDKFDVPGAIKIKSDTISYFYIALKAKYWITNSSIERGLKFKRKQTIYINTWHGSAIKNMGIYAPKSSFRFNTSECDVMYAQSQYDIDVFSTSLGIPKEKFALVGLPRNDELFNVTKKEINEIKMKLDLPLNKKIILYAPTFREYDVDKDGCFVAPPINLKKWKEKLSNEYIVLFRAHYEVNNVLGIKNNEFMRNMSDYNTLNDLLKISDILITDYSGILFDYSILKRPIYNYAYDLEKYTEKRGLYLDINKEMPNKIFTDEDELLDEICNCDFKKQQEKTEKFMKKYVSCGGDSRKYIDSLID